MLQTLNHPYTTTAKTAEIMARYRPIAPRPQTTQTSNGATIVIDVDNTSSGSGSDPPSLSLTPSIRQSAYLRNVWPYMQSRPTRTRKRGRIGPSLSAFKRPRSLLQGLSPPYNIAASPLQRLQIQVFAPPPTTSTTLVTLPLLPGSSSKNMQVQIQPRSSTVIDLNNIPEEKDLLAQLQNPPSPNIFTPTAMRLRPSTVMIRAIKNNAFLVVCSRNMRKPSYIEKDLESQGLPGFVTDSKNRVRLVNPAYEKMVGQPECAWIGSMVNGNGSEVACKSICGDVALKFAEDGQTYMVSTSGFSCWARIEWEVNGKRTYVNAFGEARRLACKTTDYKYTWRFHTKEPSEAALNV
uniref:uncharacterized protein LOC122587833 n=1 Tax=Erigeron canadensis TaxID=72917 RepID=UPI001CB8F86F|nr:uncharacterized protein LOC122587833 [Erigeron canadensis]